MDKYYFYTDLESDFSRSQPHGASGKFYLREGATCQQMNRDEIREFFYREGLVYFDEKPNSRLQKYRLTEKGRTRIKG